MTKTVKYLNNIDYFYSKYKWNKKADLSPPND